VICPHCRKHIVIPRAPGGGRKPVLRPCPICGQSFTARELRQHEPDRKPRLPLWNCGSSMRRAHCQGGRSNGWRGSQAGPGRYRSTEAHAAIRGTSAFFDLHISSRAVSSVSPFMTTKRDNLQPPATRLLYCRPWKRFFAGFREQMTELTSMEPGTNTKLTEDEDNTSCTTSSAHCS
jgi:hypothetical protein